MRLVMVGIVLAVFTSAADAGGRSFKIEPGSILSPSYRHPTPRHYEPPAPPSPPLTAFDRNMMPAANAKSAGDYDLSERITFDDPPPKHKRN